MTQTVIILLCALGAFVVSAIMTEDQAILTPIGKVILSLLTLLSFGVIIWLCSLAL